jgi:hypothetical protein
MQLNYFNGQWNTRNNMGGRVDGRKLYKWKQIDEQKRRLRKNNNKRGFLYTSRANISSLAKVPALRTANHPEYTFYMPPTYYQ